MIFRFVLLSLVTLGLTAGLSACGIKSKPVYKDPDTGNISTRNSYPPAPSASPINNTVPEL